jgi:ubiquinone/menaquinone biosynthesis C-methylase UbiE
MGSSLRISLDVSLTPKQAFDAFVDELALAMNDRGMTFNTLPGGKVTEGGSEVGIVQEWKAGERISILWRPKNWEPDTTSKLLITFKANNGGTSVIFEHEGLDRVLGDDAGELLGWVSGEAIAPLISASAPKRLGDWITDRRARRPSGAMSRGVYVNPTHHWPNFLAILDVLALNPKDNLVEVGCGGGAFLHEGLKSGCQASAIDHSPDMVRLATEKNQESIGQGRLKIAISEADSLPFPDQTFTCAIMTGVLGFLPDPLRAFKEVYRVLAGGGRFITFSGSKELRGTPAAPEPMASRLHFYEAGEIEDMARRAGFVTVRVEHPLLYEYAKKAGLG